MSLEKKVMQLLDKKRAELSGAMAKSKDLEDKEIIPFLEEFFTHDLEQYERKALEREWFKKHGSDYVLIETDDGKEITTSVGTSSKGDYYFFARFPLMEDKFPVRIQVFCPPEIGLKPSNALNKRVIFRGKMTLKYNHVDQAKRTKNGEFLSEFLKRHDLDSLEEINRNEYFVNYSFNVFQSIKVIKA